MLVRIMENFLRQVLCASKYLVFIMFVSTGRVKIKLSKTMPILTASSPLSVD